jgi:nucleoside-diphosphate-sugar epimerase
MIYLTGASGYLGQHIVRLGGDDVVPVPRDRYDMVEGQCVIHAGWPMPPADQCDGPISAARLLDQEPRFVLYVSTRAIGSSYAQAKESVEWMVNTYGQLTQIVRFPGLYGPSRRSGLMYSMFAHTLRGETFLPDHPLPYWTGMRVERAAQICLDLARAQQPGLTIARDEEFEEWLTFCRT